MLKILQARLQQYVNHELPDVQAGFKKRQSNQRSNCQHPLSHRKWKKIPEKNIYFCFIDCAKAFYCVDHNILWKILKEMGIPDHLTCLLKNLYAGQEAIVRTEHGKMDWFQIEKGIHQGCIFSPCLFFFYAECIMWNAGWVKHKLETSLLEVISIPSYTPKSLQILIAAMKLKDTCSLEEKLWPT